MSRACNCYTCLLVTAAVDLGKALEKIEFTKEMPSNTVRVLNPQEVDEVRIAFDKFRKLVPGEWI